MKTGGIEINANNIPLPQDIRLFNQVEQAGETMQKPIFLKKFVQARPAQQTTRVYLCSIRYLLVPMSVMSDPYLLWSDQLGKAHFATMVFNTKIKLFGEELTGLIHASTFLNIDTWLTIIDGVGFLNHFF